MQPAIFSSNLPLLTVNNPFDYTLLLDQFLKSQDVKPTSCAVYHRSLRQFFRWLSQHHLTIPHLSRQHILQYKQDLFNSSLSELTIGSYLKIVRKLFEWLESNRFFPNIAKGIKTPPQYKGFKKDPLTILQIKDLLSSYDLSHPIGKRDFAIMNLLIRCGLRTIEVVRANVGDIGQKAGETILYIQGKGKDAKDAFVILTPKVHQALLDYLDTRKHLKPHAPLFASYSRNNLDCRLTTRTIRKIAKAGILKIGIHSNRVTAHSLRHTAGVNILRAGGDLYAAQLFMRHENPATTQIYLRAVEEEIRLKSAPEKLLDNMF